MNNKQSLLTFLFCDNIAPMLKNHRKLFVLTAIAVNCMNSVAVRELKKTCDDHKREN